MELEVNNNIVYIGRTNFRDNQRIFGIKVADRRQHMYVIGKTGTGKTTLLENSAIQDIRAGRGLAIIDPHGEFVERMLTQIPPNRVNDVVYFNPVDTEHPIGFNVLEVQDPQYKHLVVSDLLGIFTKIWANVWSARMEYILQNSIMALLDTPGTTLLGIPRILVDKEYRQKIVSNITDPVVRSFWMYEYEAWRDQFRNEAIVPIQNKVNQFLNTSFIRNIVGQPRSRLDIPDIMNSGKILLVNVSKGRVGEDNSALLGAMIITKIQLAAMERVRIAEAERRDFYLYVDEFQNFATDSFAAILSEARKYRLNLIIAHQYIGQLVTDVSTRVRDAVFGNVGTMISFRVGAADAEFLEKEFEPEFSAQDLINLPNYNIYIKLMVDGVTSRPFSAVTLPPIRYQQDVASAQEVIEASRKLYAEPRSLVEERIARWSGMNESDEGISGVPTKTNYESICWNCGRKATVPFKPDGKRPVYCSSCLKQIEEGRIVPIHKKMPQVSERITFPDTLSGIGIEVEETASVSAQQQNKKSGDDAKNFQASPAKMHSSSGFISKGSTNKKSIQMPNGKTAAVKSSSKPDFKNEFKGSPVNSSPAIRGSRTAPISLSVLRNKRESNKDKQRISKEEKRKGKTNYTGGIGSKRGPDIEGLRAAIRDILEEDSSEDSTNTDKSSPSGRLAPGQRVKFDNSSNHR